MDRLTRLLVVVLVVVAASSCATSGAVDPHRFSAYRDYTARNGFASLYRNVLIASWEVLTVDLGARVDRMVFDPLRPPVPTPGDPRPEHTLSGRLTDLEQLGDVELDVRVSAPEVVSADMAGDGASATVQVRLRLRTSVDPELDDAALEDRELVAQAFWDALDVRLEQRIGPFFTADRPRSSP